VASFTKKAKRHKKRKRTRKWKRERQNPGLETPVFCKKHQDIWNKLEKLFQEKAPFC